MAFMAADIIGKKKDLHGISTIQAHLAAAYPHLQKALSTLTPTNAQDAALAVLLLMGVAMQMGDLVALRSHFWGLASLVSCHTELILEDAYVAGLVHVWGFAFTTTRRYGDIPDFLRPTWIALVVLDQWQDGLALTDMFRSGLIVKNVASAGTVLSMFRYNRSMGLTDGWTLARVADDIRLSWENGRGLQMLLDHCPTPLDKAIRLALIVVFSVENRPHPEPKVSRHISMATLKQVSRCDLGVLQQKAPEALVWIALVIGAAAAPADQPFVRRLLLRASLALHLVNFDSAKAVCQRFAWSGQLDDLARSFWARSWATRTRGAVDNRQPLDWLPDSLRLTRYSNVPELCNFCQREDCPTWLRCDRCGQDSCPGLLQDAGMRYGWQDFPQSVRGMLWGGSMNRFREFIGNLEWFDGS